MRSLKISTRLFLLIGLLAVLMTIIGVLGLQGIDRANDDLKSVYDDKMVPTAQLGDIRARVLHNRLDLNIALVTPTPEIIKQRVDDIDANIAAIGKTWEAYTAAAATPSETELAKTFAEARATFVRDALRPTMAALVANNFDEARRLATDKVRPLSAPLESSLDALIALQLDEAKTLYDEAEQRYVTIHRAAITAVVVGLLIAGFLGRAMVRDIGRQLGAEPGEAADLARSVAEGDLSAPIDLRSGDTTSLMAQLKAMQLSLARVVGEVRQNADSVATASAQIAQGNLDLSGRTEEQASALEETAASMEQLGSTVRQNADNARQANQLAQGASEVALKGGEVVGRVVETMQGINDSSRQIADIIGVIDGIAFQTNILALNAAVEAARAGEQGRGFAVVASEVRSLAQRSAEAAKQIKALIGASVERVEQGTALVDEAGKTMAEVVGAIRRVTDIMGEISAASTEQSAGVAQIGSAMSQMDQATQQNAALVEESAAAAESLSSQAQQLVKAVAVFKLATGAVSPTISRSQAVNTPAPGDLAHAGDAWNSF